MCFYYQDPKFWTYRPMTEMMIRAATDDVRFLLYIYHKLMEKLNEKSLWQLSVRGSLYCRCFCINDNDYADWPPLPSLPGSCIKTSEIHIVCLFSMHVKVFKNSFLHFEVSVIWLVYYVSPQNWYIFLRIVA